MISMGFIGQYLITAMEHRLTIIIGQMLLPTLKIGVDGKNAYTNFVEKFSGTGAKFIWSTNVILDNEVIVRYLVN